MTIMKSYNKAIDDGISNEFVAKDKHRRALGHESVCARLTFESLKLAGP
jgi:hypothetical protein